MSFSLLKILTIVCLGLAVSPTYEARPVKSSSRNKGDELEKLFETVEDKVELRAIGNTVKRLLAPTGYKVGVMKGAVKLPGDVVEAWYLPLEDKLRSCVIGFSNVKGQEHLTGKVRCETAANLLN